MKNEYFELTAWQTLARWFVSLPWQDIMFWLFVIIIVFSIITVGAYSMATTCTNGMCKLEQYRQCRITQPELGEEGCVLYVVD